MLEGPELLSRLESLAGEEQLFFAASAALSDVGDERFADWLLRGFDGEMGYLRRYADRRLAPEVFFDPYRSVVSLLAPYDQTPPSEKAGVGNIARYALGDDYHEVLKAKLRRVIEALRAEDATLEARALVDTAPILEKIAAARAGLGWQGKHTNLIREGEGSWFFLAEILINRDLVASSSAKDRCGTCEACIDVCPTGAIVAPYVLDARRCISYLTIELRGPIPHEWRPYIGNRIFGCDDCQEVCPWNRRATEAPIVEFKARPGMRDRSLVEWLEMDLEAWRRCFRRSAVKRAKYDGFKRNVAVALGCAADPATIPSIVAAWGKEGPLVRAHLAWALGRMPEGQGQPWLLKLRDAEVDAEVQEEIEAALVSAT